MVENSEAYFEQTKKGESRWWSWLAAFWFFLVGWIIAQTVVTGPIPVISAEIDPEKADAVNQIMFDSISKVDQGLLAISGLGILLGSAIGALFYLISRFSSGTTQIITGIIAGLGMFASAAFLFNLFPHVNDAEANNAFMELIGLSPINYALMLATFPVTLGGLFLVQKFIHMRSIRSLHTAAARIDWRRMVYAALLVWVVYGLMYAVTHALGISTLKMSFDPARFFGFALVTLIFIPLQSGTEEVVFRGYLNQAFGHFISNKWIVFAITSALFAAMHLSNPEAVSGAEQGGLMHMAIMSQYFMFGFVACIIVYFEGGLEAAIGFHAGNNMFAAMFVNFEGSVLPTPSVFLTEINPSFDIPVGFLTMAIITWLLYRSRKPIVPAGQEAADVFYPRTI